MKILIFCLLLTLFIWGCESVEISDGATEEPSEVIKTIKSDKVECPSSLDKEYRFFYSASKMFLKDILIEDLNNKEGVCVTCRIGEDGFRYCEEIQFGEEPIFVQLILKESRTEEREGPESTSGLKALTSCSEIPDIQGTWTYYEVEELKCYSTPQTVTSGCGDGKCLIGESCSNCPDDCGECPVKGSTTTTQPRGGCAVGNCYSNGNCCPNYAPYYCYRTDKCHATQQEAMSASQGACSSFKTIC